MRKRERHPISEADAERREPGRGRSAHKPSDIPKAGWRDILLRVWQRFGDDNLSLVAAGVALNTLLAVFPAMAVLASIYGMFASLLWRLVSAHAARDRNLHAIILGAVVCNVFISMSGTVFYQSFVAFLIGGGAALVRRYGT